MIGERRQGPQSLEPPLQAIKGGDSSVDVALQKGDVIYVPQGAKHSDIFGGLGGSLLYFLTRLIPIPF